MKKILLSITKLKKIILLLLFLIVFPIASEGREFDLNGQLINLFLLRNDSDFDRSEPIYLPSGQSVGLLGTYFRPEFTMRLQDLRIYYEFELGLNLWSRSRIEIEPEETRNFFVLIQRQIYADGALGNSRFRAGYQQIKDPTGLFINHWIGAFKLYSENIDFVLGQMPDQTYEGWFIDRNNFRNDIFVLILSTRQKLSDNWTINAGISNLYDNNVIGKPKLLSAPVFDIEHRDGIKYGLGLALQGGFTEKGAFDKGKEYSLASGAQIYILDDASRLGWGLNLLVLSPDNSADKDGINYGFLYSGKSKSRTILFTEDEIRDKGDNLDERIGERVGGFSYNGNFFLMRSGFALLDGSILYRITDKLGSSLTVGVASALQEKNTLNSIFLGTETTLLIRYKISDLIVFDLANSVLIPGAGLSAYINNIDREATDPMYSLESALNVVF